MKKLGIAVMALAVVGLAACAKSEQAGGAAGWKDGFAVDKNDLARTGRNPYFILEPGYRLHVSSGKDTLVVSVLEETEVVDGVTTRVVEERETENGKLAEVSRNFFALDPATRDVYYFGEDVDEYKDGKIVGHEGAWRAGVNGAKFGLMMPGKPKVVDKYYQEIAPKVAMDRAEVVGLADTLETPAGSFKDCLRVKETSAIEKGSSIKVYAPGVGLIKDDEFVLTKAEQGEAEEAKEAENALSKLAKITLEKARELALQEAKGEVKGGELELEDGILIYSFDIQVSPALIKEIHIDAKTGQFLKSEEEKIAPAKKPTGEEEEEEEEEEKEEEKGEKGEVPAKATAKEKTPAFVGTVKIGEVKDLAKLAKVTEAQARAAALKIVDGEATACVLEDEDGYLVYNVTVKFNGENFEVLVDAGTGKVVRIEIE
jgi:uncharacterized membrane protein YkoI